jgi:hypothetical protein
MARSGHSGPGSPGLTIDPRSRERADLSISFLRRKKNEPEPPPPAPPVEEVEAREYSARLTLMGRSSDALRLAPGPASAAVLPSIVESFTDNRVETIEPLPLDLANASPAMERFTELQQWVVARRDVGPVGRHALWVLEQIDALDMTVDTFYCALLYGETDTSGYPEYQAIVGGIASHWDELSGELVARAVVGWGGKGLRGDTDRIGGKLLSTLHANLLASGHALGPAEATLPLVGERTGLACMHCGFQAGTVSAMYCPRCGMRMTRSS